MGRGGLARFRCLGNNAEPAGRKAGTILDLRVFLLYETPPERTSTDTFVETWLFGGLERQMEGHGVAGAEKGKFRYLLFRRRAGLLFFGLVT